MRLEATISKALAQEVKNMVKLGLFRDTSEVVESALKKMLAEQSREYLRDFIKNIGLTEKELLREWKKTRK